VFEKVSEHTEIDASWAFIIYNPGKGHGEGRSIDDQNTLFRTKSKGFSVNLSELSTVIILLSGS
jgi:hypothetical protein